jgi:hypothetical protein
LYENDAILDKKKYNKSNTTSALFFYPKIVTFGDPG